MNFQGSLYAPSLAVASMAFLALLAPLSCSSNSPGTPGGPGAPDASGGADSSPSEGGGVPAEDSGGTVAEAGAPDSSSDSPVTPDQAAPPPPDGGYALPSGTPATVLLDGARLAMVQQQLAGGSGGSAAQVAAFHNLIAAADLDMTAGTWTVTSKNAQFVANGDKHNYVSWGPYWWPPDANPPSVPGTTSLCQYVNHDGIHNPNIDMITDRHALHATSETLFELALAWYFTGNTRYADQAELVARTFFLNPDTAMNPNMDYAQQHGPCGPRNAAGLIEATGGYMTDALDGLAILALDMRPSG